MLIAAASDALARHLRARLRETGAWEEWAVEAMTLPEARHWQGPGVALALWRVQPDDTPGDALPLRTGSEAEPLEGMGLKLRYLLVVRGADPRVELAMLGLCMAVLDRHPVIEEPGAPGGGGAEALVVAIETPPDGAYLRLVEACGDPPPLLVPYAVRSVRLRPPVAGHIPDRPPR